VAWTVQALYLFAALFYADADASAKEKAMTTMDDRVQQAADALIRATSGDIANWELAQLTYENTKAHGRPPVEDERMAIADWCERIRERSGRKFSRATGVLYRSIWEKYKNYERSSFPEWNDAYYDVRGKSREAMDNEFVTAKARHVIDGLEHVKPEVKRALADRIMSEPDIGKCSAATKNSIRKLNQNRRRGRGK
jgi:hypothetical protein